MKLKKGIVFLLLSSSVWAYNQQEINEVIKQQTKKPQLHHLFRHLQNSDNLIWESLQGPEISKTFNILAIKNSNVLFAYHPYDTFAGIYKSPDKGQHWKAITIPKMRTLRDLISIDENHLLLAADNKIYSSLDQGEHWTLSATIDNSCDHLFSPNPGLVLLSTNFSYSMGNLYRSFDGGQTFTPARLGIEDGFPFFALGGRDNILLVGHKDIFISTNNGVFWSSPSTHWSNQVLKSVAIGREQDIFMLTNYGLFKTDVKGQAWENLNKNFDSVDSVKVKDVKIDAYDRLFVVAGNETLYRSLDKGQSWKALHRFKQIIDFTLLENGKILVNTNNGLMRSDDTQVNYTKIGDLPYSSSSNNRVVALDNNHFFTTTKKFSSPLYASDDSGKTWRMTRPNQVIDVAAFDRQVITLEYSNHQRQIFSSSDFGETWAPVFQITDNKNSCYALSSQNKGLIVNCDNESYFTKDLLHWYTLKTAPKNPTVTSYFSGKKIYITDGDSIKSSEDYGLTWTYLLNNINQYRAYVSGYNDEVLIIAIDRAGIIKMTDGGKNWDLINDGLTDFYFSTPIIINKDYYLIATGDGLFVTQDGGKHWIADNGLNNYSVLSLSVYQKTLLAGTNGGGVFKAQLKSVASLKHN